MTPLQFEQQYQQDWETLESLLKVLRASRRKETKEISGSDFAALYRRVCEHLALARARAYPAYITDRLDQLTHDAHQVIYQRREFGFARLKALIAYEIPQAVRKQSTYVWIATAVFVLPTLIIGLLVYFRPELILSVVDPATASDFERMYSPDAESI
ncbi:MAG: stage II sporulation protein M, partial [Povalibacter sp.]